MCEPVNWDFSGLDWEPVDLEITPEFMADLNKALDAWEPEGLDLTKLGGLDFIAVDRPALAQHKDRITELLDQVLEQDRATLAELMAKIREDNTQLESVLAEEREKLAGLMAEIKAESDSVWKELGLQPQAPAKKARKKRANTGHLQENG